MIGIGISIPPLTPAPVPGVDGVPANAITINGEPITLGGEFITVGS